MNPSEKEIKQNKGIFPLGVKEEKYEIRDTPITSLQKQILNKFYSKYVQTNDTESLINIIEMAGSYIVNDKIHYYISRLRKSWMEVLAMKGNLKVYELMIQKEPKYITEYLEISSEMSKKEAKVVTNCHILFPFCQTVLSKIGYLKFDYIEMITGTIEQTEKENENNIIQKFKLDELKIEEPPKKDDTTISKHNSNIAARV